jgi:threonine dehydratase
MYECVKAGRVIDVATHSTLSDGTAGGVEPGAITLPLCQALVDRFVLVSEDEILAGMQYVLEEHHLVVEGSAGVAVAAARKLPAELRGRRVVLVMCGGNVSHATLRRVVTPEWAGDC